MDDAARAAFRAAAVREFARRDLHAFTRLTSPGYVTGWFNRRVAAELQRFSVEVSLKRSPRLMLFAPPRHGKSEIASRKAPAWHLGRNPGHDVVCASYAADLARRHSRGTRQLARSDLGLSVFPSLAPPFQARSTGANWQYRRNDVDTVDLWSVTGGGTYKAVGVGGPLTGQGAHWLGIDDPVKDAKDAYSQVVRETTWDWYTHVARTRVATGGGISLALTRWHEDDLAGRLLRREGRIEDGGRWRVVSFPAIAEDVEHDLEGNVVRRPGDALHPERWPLHELLEIKATIGERAWLALYQQRPAPAGGRIFRRDWIKRYSVPPAEIARTADEVGVSVDCSFKGLDSSDRVAILVWARQGGNYFLIDRVVDFMGLVDTIRAILDLLARWRVDFVLVEDRANGSAVLETMGQAFDNLVPYPAPGERFDPKPARARAASVSFEAGAVHVPTPEHMPDVGEYVEEVVGYPGGAPYDDQVDATSQIVIRWRTQGTVDPVERMRSEFGDLGWDF